MPLTNGKATFRGNFPNSSWCMRRKTSTCGVESLINRITRRAWWISQYCSFRYFITKAWDSWWGGIIPGKKKKIKIKNINNCKEESYFLYLSSFQYSTSCVFVPSFHLFWKVSAEWFLYTTAVHFLKFYTLSEVTENIYIQLTNAKILFTAVLITLLTENYFTHCIRD